VVHLPDGLEIIWPSHFGAQIETGEYGQHVGDLGTHVGILQLTHHIVSGTCIQISYGDVRIRVGCSMPDLPGMVSACCNLCKFVSVKGCGAGWTADAGCVCRKDTSTDLRFLQTQFTIFVLTLSLDIYPGDTHYLGPWCTSNRLYSPIDGNV